MYKVTLPCSLNGVQALKFECAEKSVLTTVVNLSANVPKRQLFMRKHIAGLFKTFKFRENTESRAKSDCVSQKEI